MPVTSANGIEICYETHGSPSDPALLLVHGFTAQLTSWDDGFVDSLVDRGLHVVRMDNRDAGHSTYFDGIEPPVAAVMAARRDGSTPPEVPYLLTDMAADGIGLLDSLSIERAHIAGASMGGMIVQTMAIHHPDRVASLCSIMSHTGDMRHGRSTKEANAALLSPPPVEREANIEAAVANARIWSTRRHWDEAVQRRRAEIAYDRAFHPEGAGRQLTAIMASPDRSDALASLDMPTLVIHGRDDTLITPSGGERTAQLVPGAVLLMLNDMGHDLPRPLWPVLADSIAFHISRAEAR
mgnify:CR=1 FL=1